MHSRDSPTPLKLREYFVNPQFVVAINTMTIISNSGLKYVIRVGSEIQYVSIM